MNKSVYALWKYVLNIGFNASMDHLQQMRLFALNGFLLIGLILTLLFVSVFTTVGSINALEGLSIVPVILIVFYLNSKGRLVFARFVFTYALIVVVLILALADRRTGTEYILIALGCCGVLLFEKVTAVIACFMFAFISYVVYVIIDNSQPFIPDPQTPYLIVQNSLMFLSGFAVVAQSLVFRSTITKYAVDLTSANHEVASMNEELGASNEELFSLTENLDLIVKQKSADLQAYRDAINVNLLSMTIDFNGKILSVNEQYLKVVHYDSEELVGENISVLTADNNPETIGSLRRAVSAGKPLHTEAEIRMKGGALVWIEVVVLSVEGHTAEPYYLILGFPISERKELELAQLKSAETLEALAFHTSHEIKGPLSRILGLTNLLERDFVEKKELTFVAKQLVVCSRELDKATTELTGYINIQDKDFATRADKNQKNSSGG
ncbi:MAG: PAS domain S-box protein [Chryseolinea sp.]